MLILFISVYGFLNKKVTNLKAPIKTVVDNNFCDTRVFRVTGLKILGTVGTHIFFFWKKYSILKGHFAFENAKIIYFFQKT